MALPRTAAQLVVVAIVSLVVLGLFSLFRTGPGCPTPAGAARAAAGSVSAEFARGKASADIGGHMDALLSYARQCGHITELGVRDVVSSWAFLLGLVEHKKDSAKPVTLLMVDPYMSPNVFTVQQAAEGAGVRFAFMLADDLVAPLEATDMTFIDTAHIMGQLKRELARVHSLTRRWIILHGARARTFDLNWFDLRARRRHRRVYVCGCRRVVLLLLFQDREVSLDVPCCAVTVVDFSRS